MDFSSLAALYAALPPVVQMACDKAATAILTKTIGATWDKLAKEDGPAALAAVYRKWKEDLPGSDQERSVVFEGFFGRDRVHAEFQKLLRNDYEHVDFDILEAELRESCEGFISLKSHSDLADVIDRWARELLDALESNPQFRKEYQLALALAKTHVNYSLARRHYLRGVTDQHRLIRFSGQGTVGGDAQVERVKIFVMPRVSPQEREALRAAPEPVPAHALLSEATRQAVILGGPGSGKTTLLESLSLALAQGVDSPFPWAAELPRLLPVMFRVREFDPYLETHPQATVWDFLRDHGAAALCETLPPDFFPRAMESQGLLVLIDGLDEAGSADRRERVVKRVEAFAAKLTRESRLIVTTRPYDYLHRFDPGQYRHVDLCPFDDAEIQNFLGAWCASHEADRVRAENRATALWPALESRKPIKDLAGTRSQQNSTLFRLKSTTFKSHGSFLLIRVLYLIQPGQAILSVLAFSGRFSPGRIRCRHPSKWNLIIRWRRVDRSWRTRSRAR
jgi:NACHT domain